LKIIIPVSILIILVLSVYCSSGNKNINTDIKILKLPKSGKEMLMTSSFADTVIYIPLEKTAKSLIDDIESIWMNDSVILIESKHELLMFNLNGKFIRQIGKKGRGPGEYGGIFSFVVARDTIYLSSPGRRGFLRYTLDGTFCDEVILKYEPVCFSTTADEKLAVFNEFDGKVYVYNNGFNMPDTIVVEYGVSELRLIRSAMGGAPLTTCFQKTSSGLLFNDYLNDTVWNITGNKKEPVFILDTKDKLLPWDKQIEYYTMDNTPEWMEMAKSYHLFNLVPVSSNMFIFQNAWYDDDYSEDNIFYNSVYFGNAKIGEIRKFDYIYDDIVGKQKLTWFYHIYSTDYLVGEIAPFNLLKKGAKDTPSLAWLNQMKTIKEDDNPILVLIKLKKNLK
jgi:hypothetical protein